jgi:hypothetical protein
MKRPLKSDKKSGKDNGPMTYKGETTNDPQELLGTGAIKYDAGKAPIFRGFLSYFPRAIRAVAEVSGFGAEKYAWHGWERVDDGFNRYSDAMVRHIIAEGEGESLDPDSGLLHAAHIAWNALARLELLIREEETILDLKMFQAQLAGAAEESITPLEPEDDETENDGREGAQAE